MRRSISFNPGNFHYKQPTQEVRDRPESPAAGSSLATPGNMAADAAAHHEQLTQLNKTVLDDFIQKAEKHPDNTKFTINYHRDVLEEVADFLAKQPQILSLQDLQRLNNCKRDDRMRLDDLTKKFNVSRNAKITLRPGYGATRTNMLFGVFDILRKLVAPDASIKLSPAEISRQAERLIHEYANTPLDRAQISEKYLRQYACDLKHLAKWLDAKRESGQPVSDEENSLEKLGSLEKLRTYPDDKSVKKVIEHFRKEKKDDPKFPERTKNGIGAAVKSFRKLMGSQENRASGSSVSVTAPVAAVPAVFQRMLRPKIQVSHQAEQIIAAYKAIVQRKESHKERVMDVIKSDAWRLRCFANWVETLSASGKKVLHGLDSLEKLGNHRDTDEVKAVLESFKQNSAAPLSAKNKIQSTVDVFRWIWHRIEAKLKEEKQAADDFEADQFAAELEAALSSHSPCSPQNVAGTSITLSEEPLAQPHRPIPEASERRNDAELDHMPQTSEVSAAAIEDQGAPFEPEWNIPFDPAELGAGLYGFENVSLGDDFFDFMRDEDWENLHAASPTEERQRQPGVTVTSQVGMASSSQAKFGTAHPHAGANPSSSTVPAPLAPPNPERAEFRRQLLGEVGEAARLKRPAPESQTGPRSVRSRTAPPLAPPRPQQTALQQRLLAHASSLARPSFPSRPRSRRGTADKDKNE